MVLQERLFKLRVNLICIVGNTEIINDTTNHSIKAKKVNSFIIDVYQSDTLAFI